MDGPAGLAEAGWAVSSILKGGSDGSGGVLFAPEGGLWDQMLSRITLWRLVCALSYHDMQA